MTKEENMEHILDDIIFDNNPVVVGVSSGPDSMCLLNLLEQKTNKLVVCHINHNVRKESTTEEEYLKDYCQKHNLIFESMKITEYKETNFENEARKKRYNFYEEILSKYHSTKLFLAHHGDDHFADPGRRLADHGQLHRHGRARGAGNRQPVRRGGDRGAGAGTRPASGPSAGPGRGPWRRI